MQGSLRHFPDSEVDIVLTRFNFMKARAVKKMVQNDADTFARL